MKLIQHFHDYLVKTKLLNPEDLEVWESEGRVYSVHDFSGDHEMVKRREFTMNLSVNNVSDGFDFDSLEFAVAWWINVWGKNRNQQEPAFLIENDIENRRVTDVWIGFSVEEKTIFKDGEVCRCVKPNILKKDMNVDNLPHFLRFVDYGLEVPLVDE